ncbi:hypothetical protein CBR_g20240 [Chara braunii]|uniref:Uncharacterized protein n=1 Tax=Chara braunii TaxID=69332 RepID=A0A388KZX7_CHABU|nr:hypothetical protein CBR_g20240 [Chara braunii]|eukprot:GBG75609.1 hypothetical protein CBR_g20240 [Chara braunii]
MDGMENITVLDFRTAFQGSVFEKYHIVPLQVASLDTTYLSRMCFDFLVLKMKPYDDGAVHQDHAECLADRLKHWGAGELDCHTFVKHALEFFKEYTDNLFHDFCEQTGMPWVEDPNDVPFQLEDELQPSDFYEGLHHFLIQNHTSEMLEICFARCGMDLRRESDNDIVRRLYGYGRRMRGATYGDSKLSWCLFMILHQIDFDLVGLDGQHFPLRMLLLEEEPWCADVMDRETGALIADAINLAEGGAFRWSHRTEVRSKSMEAVEQRYKPHGDILTLPNRVCRCDELPPQEVFDVSFSEHGHAPSRTLLSELTPEQLKSVKDLKRASFCRRNCIVYSTHSEFEHVIPIAANLGPVCRQARKDDEGFDEVVAEYRLQPSLQKDVVDFQCNHFRRILKGTIWQNLPQDLVIRIVQLLPRQCTISRCNSWE